MQGRSLAEACIQLGRIHRGDPGRVQVAQSAQQLRRTTERFLDGDLLVEGKADEQGQRIAGEQAVGGIVSGERQSISRGSHGRHGTRRAARLQPPARNDEAGSDRFPITDRQYLPSLGGSRWARVPGVRTESKVKSRAPLALG